MTRLEELYAERVAIARRWEELAAEIEAEKTADAKRRIEYAAALASMEQVLVSAAIEDAARLYDVTLEDVLGQSRDRRIVKARQAAMWLLRQRDLSFPAIGAVMGRDHTTVMYACQRIDSDPAVRALLAPMLGKVAA